jgi:hypothetical protein
LTEELWRTFSDGERAVGGDVIDSTDAPLGVAVIDSTAVRNVSVPPAV